MLDASCEDHQFLSAKACHDVLCTHGFLRLRCDNPEDGVASLVTEHVVHALEVVQVEEPDSEVRAVAACVRNLGGEAVIKVPAIVESS